MKVVEHVSEIVRHPMLEGRRRLVADATVEMRHRPEGVMRMGADGSGEHDDLVTAVALACWKAKRKENSFGTRRLPGI